MITHDKNKDLAEANRHIEAATLLIEKQRQIIAKLTVDRHDTGKAYQILQASIDSMEGMQRHRELIYRRIHKEADALLGY